MRFKSILLLIMLSLTLIPYSSYAYEITDNNKSLSPANYSNEKEDIYGDLIFCDNLGTDRFDYNGYTGEYNTIDVTFQDIGDYADSPLMGTYMLEMFGNQIRMQM